MSGFVEGRPMSVDRMNVFREAGRLRRLHQMTCHEPYDIAQHSWRMAAYLFLLNTDPGPSKRLIWAVLFHDVPERWLGDMPAPTKWSCPDVSRALDATEVEIEGFLGLAGFHLTNEEAAWLKALDMLELYIYCLDEYMLGNRHLDQVRTVAYNILTTKAEVPRPVADWVREYKWKREDNIWSRIKEATSSSSKQSPPKT
jgi:5'-deoxynucleotidase YfbR-like HD superfamily hydrolase